MEKSGDDSISDKLVFLGLDALTWRVVKDAARIMDMTHFKRLEAMATQYGQLSCMDPIVSPASWTSIATGCIPEEHWIYDFFILDEQLNRSRTTRNHMNPHMMPFWDFFEQPLLLHYPCTFPPVKTMRMASGMLTPRHELGIANESFRKYMNNHFPAYNMVTNNAQVFRKFSPQRIFTRPFRRSLEKTQREFLKKELAYLDQQMEVFLHFLSRKDFDILGFVTASPDVTGHLLYNNHELHYIFLQRLDHHLGEVLDCVENEMNLLVCSDHGMHPFTRHVYINQLFHEWGYQEYNRINLIFKKPILHTSKIFFLGHGLVFINSKEKFSQGMLTREETEQVKSEIITRLENVYDPFSNTKVIKSIYEVKKDRGGQNIFPDLILEPAEGYELSSTYNLWGKGPVDATRDYRSGTHHRMGMYAYYDGNSTGVCKDILATDVFSILSPHFPKTPEIADIDF
ncbi:MAG: alkaline phosphatase family protein [Theionarchaea archaeon]|nr:alkaline phosphatase family protein [Theionarchaea archaeon]